MYRCATFVVFLVLGIAVQLSNGTEVNVKDKDNNLCLYAKLMVNFRVSYEVAVNEVLTAEFELPASVASDGSTCDSTSSMFKLNFGEGHSWSVNFTREGKIYQVDTITFSYNLSDASIFPNSTSTETTTIYVKPEIKDVGVDTFYSCQSEDTYETDSVRQTLRNVLIQAFVINNSTSENITLCAADVPTTPAALIAIVLPTTTTTVPTPTTTTTAPTTTVPPTTTTTAPTTTVPPTTTTEAPVTNSTTTDAPVTNSTTTDAPVTNSTTTAPPPTPTPTPTLPAPTTGKYKLQPDVNSTACLLADFGLRFKIKDEEMNFEPNGTAVTGKCEMNSSELVLTSSTVTIKFTFTNDTKKFRLHALNVTGKTSSGVEFSTANTNLTLWEATIGSSYMCNKEQNYTINADLSIYTFELRVQPLAVEKGIFSTAEDCQADGDSFLVPIAVGVSLLVLILIVLLAYFIGRKRNMTVGYESF
ncbi:lysosome-associated membrane glycoprotein 2 isoform X1 [Notothenia coriiceps]|uniref:Lysosome-associated membrane glycoprotein 2 isoform X1 n=1 Tax=Notothenia coriiceps TaxID=8208 RepID=A0A6I9MJR5_9TELE|nr:PREDICTED: lysosome-associated membrane glycoprotein 2 isoform X1 [Notothenia coriiceps]